MDRGSRKRIKGFAAKGKEKMRQQLRPEGELRECCL
jgi:hypothetical protein